METSDWTVNTLKEAVDQRFLDQKEAVSTALVAQEKAVSAALQAAKEAVLKAETAADKRFEAVNEFRGQLADQATTLMSRNEYQTAHQALTEKISLLTDRLNKLDGITLGSGITANKLYSALAAFGTILVILFFLVDRVIGK